MKHEISSPGYKSVPIHPDVLYADFLVWEISLGSPRNVLLVGLDYFTKLCDTGLKMLCFC